MSQTFPTQSEPGAINMAQPMPVDEQVAHDMAKLQSEATERCAFHRAELDRWDLARGAANAALEVLSSRQSEKPAPESLYR